MVDSETQKKIWLSLRIGDWNRTLQMRIKEIIKEYRKRIIKKEKEKEVEQKKEKREWRRVSPRRGKREWHWVGPRRHYGRWVGPRQVSTPRRWVGPRRRLGRRRRRFSPRSYLGVKWINAVSKGSASIYYALSLGTSSLRTSWFQYAPGVGVNWLNAEVPTIGVSWFDAEIWVHKKKKWTFQFTSAQVDRISHNTKFHRIHIQRWKHSDMLHQT